MSSTLSFDSLSDDDEHSFAPHDLQYNDPISGEALLVLKKGEPVPCTTKYKKKSHWDYAMKFRYLICSCIVCAFIVSLLLSVGADLNIQMLKKIDTAVSDDSRIQTVLNAGEFVTLELPLVNELTKDMTPVSTAQNSVTADNGEKICALLQGPSNLAHSITSSFSKTAKLSNESSVSHAKTAEQSRLNFYITAEKVMDTELVALKSLHDYYPLKKVGHISSFKFALHHFISLRK